MSITGSTCTNLACPHADLLCKHATRMLEFATCDHSSQHGPEVVFAACVDFDLTGWSFPWKLQNSRLSFSLNEVTTGRNPYMFIT